MALLDTAVTLTTRKSLDANTCPCWQPMRFVRRAVGEVSGSTFFKCSEGHYWHRWENFMNGQVTWEQCGESEAVR